MLLDVKDVNSYYGDSHVLQNVSLAVNESETVALLGRNGMGKSTTLKSILGMVQPKSGQIMFNGQDISNLPPYKTARMGIAYIPEERRIFPTLPVLDNLKMGIKATDNRQIKEDRRWTFERVFEHFPILKERKDHRGAHLSGGEQQMLAIARSLMGNPDLLLIDEPTEGLAPIIVEEVREVLSEISKTGVSIILVEHNIKMALSLADRVYLMGRAHIGYEGTPRDLGEHPEIKAKYLEV